MLYHCYIYYSINVNNETHGYQSWCQMFFSVKVRMDLGYRSFFYPPCLVEASILVACRVPAVVAGFLVFSASQSNITQMHELLLRLKCTLLTATLNIYRWISFQVFQGHQLKEFDKIAGTVTQKIQLKLILPLCCSKVREISIVSSIVSWSLC